MEPELTDTALTRLIHGPPSDGTSVDYAPPYPDRAGHRLQLDPIQTGPDMYPNTDYNWTLPRQGRTQTTTGPYPDRAGHRLQLDPTQTVPDTAWAGHRLQLDPTQTGPDYSFWVVSVNSQRVRDYVLLHSLK